MKRHEQKRNQTPTHFYGHANSDDQNLYRDYSRNDIPDSDRDRTKDQLSTRHLAQNEDRDGHYEKSRFSRLNNSKMDEYDYPRPRGGDDLFRNSDYYTQESDQRERKNARLGLGSANNSAHWIGSEKTGHYGKGPKGYRRSDDRVKEDVSETLYRNQNIDATTIEVEVKDGTVILKGSVESRFIKRAVENCIDHLTGVEDVRNELTIKMRESTYPENFSLNVRN